MTSTQPVRELSSIEAGTLRKVCGLFVTGVTVITSGADACAAGTTVNSFTSVSLDPPLVLFCLHKDSRLAPVVEEFSTFAVNFLASPQAHIAWAFAGRNTAVVQDIPHRLSSGGLPILKGALAFLACRVVNIVEGGDHSIFLGEVEELGLAPDVRDPLIFFRGQLGALEDDPRATHPIWDG